MNQPRTIKLRQEDGQYGLRLEILNCDIDWIEIRAELDDRDVHFETNPASIGTSEFQIFVDQFLQVFSELKGEANLKLATFELKVSVLDRGHIRFEGNLYRHLEMLSLKFTTAVDPISIENEIKWLEAFQVDNL